MWFGREAEEMLQTGKEEVESWEMWNYFGN